MEVLASIDPVTYGVDPLRQVVLRGAMTSAALEQVALRPIAVNVALMAGLSLLFLIPGVWLFSRQD
jgi:hypothetical protein